MVRYLRRSRKEGLQNSPADSNIKLRTDYYKFTQLSRSVRAINVLSYGHVNELDTFYGEISIKSVNALALLHVIA